jgi:hypothetical protein
MLKSGYDEDIAREWVPMSHLYRLILLGFQYYMGLHTNLWKVDSTYSWRHAELQMEQQCPPEHWESVRFEGSMNFTETPVPVLEGNGKMTESQLTISADFVRELISLGVLALVPHGVLLMNV